MTLGGGRIGMPLLAGGLVTVTALLLLSIGPMRTVAALPAIALASLVFLHFRAAGYSQALAALLCVLLFATPDMQALLQLDGSVWLALGMYVIAASAADALESAGVRAVILLSASLAAVQLADPIGVVLVAAIVPLLMAMPNLRRTGWQSATLAILVLFIPLATTGLLAEYGGVSAMPPLDATLAGLGIVQDALPPAHGPFALLAALAVVIPAMIVLVVQPALRSSAAVFAALLALAVIAAFALSAVSGTKREAYWLAAALLPVCAVLLASMRPAPARDRIAVAAAALSFAASWAAALL